MTEPPPARRRRRSRCLRRVRACDSLSSRRRGGRKGAPPAGERDPAKLYVDADKLVYDKDHDIVTADGAVVLYYKNRVLQGDHVVYDRKGKHVFASGHVKLTDEHGNVTYSPRLELTEDFANGFADAVQVITIDKTRLTSPRIERSNDTVTVLQKGVYTACEPCKAHPEWPPLWQVRAGEIIENQETHTIYFRDAYFDAFGVPVAYLPYFSTADPTVTRQSGFLAPSYVSKNTLGLGVTTPYFFALAPNYDLTIYAELLHVARAVPRRRMAPAHGERRL